MEKPAMSEREPLVYVFLGPVIERAKLIADRHFYADENKMSLPSRFAHVRPRGGGEVIS
jgi:hypothetical protein